MRCEGFRVTPRDREIVRWIGRHRFVTAAQVAERFGIGRSQCYARLTGLVRLGLLDHERLLYGQPGVYLATRSGLDFTDLALPRATIDVRTYRHDFELASLVTTLERQAGPGTTVWTEREVRSVDTPVGRSASEYRPSFAVLLGQSTQLRLAASRAPRVHFPDAVLVDEKREIRAVELELSVKGRSRLRTILRAYVAARHVKDVTYYARDPRVLDLLREEITPLRGDVIHVRPIPDWSLKAA